MPRRAKGLSAAKVAKAGPGRYGDGAGLYLLVRSPEAKFWTFRYVRAGKMREIGLGPAVGRAAVSLVDARLRARNLYDIHRAGRDPLEERAAGRALQVAEAAKAVTFSSAAERYIDANRAGWDNAKHARQWVNTLATYAEPVLGKLPVQTINTALVLQVLEPIWTKKPPTADRVRNRIELILDWAKARGYRTGENPARWRGHLDHLLPEQSKVRRVKHHPALPYDEIPAFMAALRAQFNIGAAPLELLILTATRTSEVLGAKWDEIDFEKAAWSIPAGRMKGRRDHRVPLSKRALEILKARSADSDFVFPGKRKGRPVSEMGMLQLLRQLRAGITVHGFRSTFRDWAGERTSYPNHVLEMALAHSIPSAVEAAYRRGDLFDKRRRLMADWAAYCAQAPAKGDRIVPLRRRAAP